ncbi:aldehyde dehydrogenase family protein [Lapidilactobacillus achengensis]|uniref:Aldehyde dehydrogenase family protein n=1 Tax=Lapidilactobacillus achengensis TaxID=2486000 RepID=A0ABW1ULK7_9LACO|nr:aldehyde dehydrogenase family protein [Lapidilactobacillus achengensis]
MSKLATTAISAPNVDDAINQLVSRGVVAFKKYQNYDQTQVDAICAAIVRTAIRHAKELAFLAYKETGRGNAEDKAIKNIYASQYIWNEIKDDQTVGVISRNVHNGLEKIAEPLGVIAGVTPVTNPTSTVIFKILLALKTRNAIIFGLHPQAQECGSATCQLLATAAVNAGAPANLIQWIQQPSIAATSALMNHPQVNLVLATGGPSMVKAAYSTGKPAMGVGPGNAPAYIEKTANIANAVADIIMSKTFDNGMICASENSIVVDRDVLEAVKQEFQRQGAFFVAPADVAKLSATVIDPERHTVRGPIAGQSATRIAALAGIKVPANTKLLIGEIAGIGPNYPLSGEKLSPVLSMYVANNQQAAFSICLGLLNYGGLGHTAVVHSQDNDLIERFGAMMPACRILVNTPGSLGGIGGLFNKLTPSLTLGTGSYGKNSISHNLTDFDLLNIKTVARATRRPHELINEIRDVLHEY